MQGKNLQGHEIKRRYKQSFFSAFMKSGNALSVFCIYFCVYFISCSGLKTVFNRWIFLAGGDSFRLSILYQLKVFWVNTCLNHVLWRVHSSVKELPWKQRQRQKRRIVYLSPWCLVMEKISDQAEIVGISLLCGHWLNQI